MQNKAGRPTIGKEKLDEAFRKIQPYLQAGLSVNRACVQAQMPKSTVYGYIERSGYFSEKIDRARQFLSVMVSNSMTKELLEIVKKQKEGKKLLKEDVKFLFWFALNSKNCNEEYGRNKNFQEIIDPELEIRRITQIIDNIRN